MSRRLLPAALLAIGALGLPAAARAQPIDMSGGGPVEVTSTDGIEWRQGEQVVVARGNARAVRDGVTVDASRLIARYRQRATAPGAAAAGASAAAQPAGEGGGDSPLSGGEIWRLEAEGNVRISTETDKAQGDRAVYDMDQAVMVLTGRDLRLSTPTDTITCRDGLEYWSGKRMAVARGAAKVVTADNRQVSADTLVAYFLEQAPPVQQAAARAPAPAAGPAIRTPGAPAASGGATRVPGEGSKLDRVELFNNVEIRTETEVVRGDRAVYSPVTGMARVLGAVRITRGQNQLQGQEAIVNLRTGISRLISAPGQRVQGLVLPSSGQEGAVPGGAAGRGAAPAGAARPEGRPEGRTR